VAKKVHGRQGEGIDLVERYTLRGYPTVIFLEPDGAEIDRITGYRPPDKFYAEMIRIADNKGTVADMKQIILADPENVLLWNQLAEKFEERGDLDSALEVWATISDLKSELSNLAEYKIIELSAIINSESDGLRNYISENIESEFVTNAFEMLLRIERNAEIPESEAKTYLEYLEYQEGILDVSSNLYNGFAWRMTQLELNLELALIYVDKGIALVPAGEKASLAGIMDTKAEVLWKLDKIEEAVATIDECINLQPDNNYFKDQRAKFLK
jgi:tetratricopeptide (TPR) repeat protein